MNDEDTYPADHTSTASTIEESKHSRRGKLKDVLNRTKSKINKAREEHEEKKLRTQQEKEKTEHRLDDDVNDFLAAGRNSAASQSSSYVETTPSPYNNPSISPRPSTSDSKVQQSPRRVVVPRIDVSSSWRFPNAKDVPDGGRSTQQNSSAISSGSGLSPDFLTPEFKIRNQSISSIASQARKAKIRGLSVGFIDAPPDIIGEGGDEAMAPPVEISRAKERARSASPLGRKPYNISGQSEPRRQMPTRGISDNTVDTFIPKPFARVQTGLQRDPGSPLPAREASMQPVHEEHDFVPKKFVRTQTNGTNLMPRDLGQWTVLSPVSPVVSNLARNDMAREHKTALHFNPNSPAVEKPLEKEFEMTLGLSPGGLEASKAKAGSEPQIFAPKPQRRPPSYDLIEAGKLASSVPPLPPQSSQHQLQTQPVPQPHPPPQLQSSHSGSGPNAIHGDYQQPQRKPVLPSQTFTVAQPPYQPLQDMRQHPQYPQSSSRQPVQQQVQHPQSHAPASPGSNQIASAPRGANNSSIQYTPVYHEARSPNYPPQLSIPPHSPLSASIRLVSPSNKLGVTMDVNLEDSFESPATAHSHHKAH